jgi:NDMA-dependent alcohol dehydrogenase
MSYGLVARPLSGMKEKSMQTRAALLWEAEAPWSVETIDLDAPRADEVLVRMFAAGLCHTDEHNVTGDLPGPYPFIGGHEGAGVVEKVGASVTSVAPGDHVAMSFIASCGRCPSCVKGIQNLCDRGMFIAEGRPISDGTFRAHVRGQHLATGNLLGTFAEHAVVHESSLIKVDADIPLELVALVSCGVATGWGSSVYAAQVRSGETVAIVGLGGIGMNAVQGARSAGAAEIVAIDLLEWKRERAKVFGATHTADSVESALGLVAEVTRGQMANCAIITTSTARPELMGSTLNLVGKRGRMIVTAVAEAGQSSIDLSLAELMFYEKTVRGALYGSANPRYDVPNLLRLYSRGELQLNELITTRYRLDDINQGFDDMRSGKNIRGVIMMDDSLAD